MLLGSDSVEEKTEKKDARRMAKTGIWELSEGKNWGHEEKLRMSIDIVESYMHVCCYIGKICQHQKLL